MKEAFEKIKERLEEESQYSCSHCMERAISIVSEVEAEYGKDINVRSKQSTEYINKSTEHINKSGDCSTNWIDVKDRLPEKDGYYLTCDHKGNIHVFYHHPSYVTNGNNMAFGICKNHPQFYKPIAWMELPKPYNRLERK